MILKGNTFNSQIIHDRNQQGPVQPWWGRTLNYQYITRFLSGGGNVDTIPNFY